MHEWLFFCCAWATYKLAPKVARLYNRVFESPMVCPNKTLSDTAPKKLIKTAQQPKAKQFGCQPNGKLQFTHSRKVTIKERKMPKLQLNIMNVVPFL